MAVGLEDPVGDAVRHSVAHRAIGAVGRAVGNAVGWRGDMAVGVSGAICGTIHPVGRGVSLAVGRGADAALDTTQRRGHTGGVSGWWKQIVVDVLDEDSLALHTR